MKHIKPQTWFSAGCLLGCTLMLLVGGAAPPKYATVDQIPLTNDGTNLKQVSGSSLGITGTVFNIDLEKVGIGDGALKQWTSGLNNIAIGKDASKSNTSGSFNLSIGLRALANNKVRADNVGLGHLNLELLDTGFENTAVGNNSMDLQTTAFRGTAVGYSTLDVMTGSRNTAVGHSAALSATGNGDYNTFLGADSGRSGVDLHQTVGIGGQALRNANSKTNSVAIGYNTTVGGSGEIRFGNGITNYYFDGFGIEAGVSSVTNGMASYSVLTTNAVGGTGYTNNQVINQTAIITGTAVAITIKNRAGTVILPATTISGTLPIPLQPGWAITAASGLTGTAVPF